jgi:hypothetical protein
MKQAKRRFFNVPSMPLLGGGWRIHAAAWHVCDHDETM